MMDPGSESGQKDEGLRHFALDRVCDEKLMERGSLNLWDNENVSKDRLAGRKLMTS